MNPFSTFIDKMLRQMGSNNNPQPQQMPQTAPTLAPTPQSNKGSGESQRKVLRFQTVDANSSIASSDESWIQNGGVLEGTTVETKAVSASGNIVLPEFLKVICSVCQKADDTEIRCAITYAPLCRTCQCTFTKPDGEEITVSPFILSILQNRFNTWEHFDAQQQNRAKS